MGWNQKDKAKQEELYVLLTHHVAVLKTFCVVDALNSSAPLVKTFLCFFVFFLFFF